MEKENQLTVPSKRKNACNNQLTIPSRRKNACNNIQRPSKRSKDDENHDEEVTDDDNDVEMFPKLETRMSPAKVVKLINELSPTQIESLSATPFRHFVNLKLSKIPTKLAHYIVANYNFRDGKITLDNGETFDVSKEDVHTALGLPIGGALPKYSVEEMQPVFTEWINQFGDDATGRMVKMDVLKKYITSHNEDGGPMFKRNMLLFIISSLICSHGNEHVFIDAFPWVVDVEKSDELDWCEFVHDKLLQTREFWFSEKLFCGPVLFLVLHFVDKVVDAKRVVPRIRPTLIGWTTKDMNKRQKIGESRGGFGGGFVQKEPLTISNTPLPTIKNQEEKEETHEQHENLPSILFHDFTCAVEKLGAAYAEVDVKGRNLLAAMPNHEVVKKLVMESRVSFNLSRLDGDKDFIESETDPTTSVTANETTRLSQDLFFESQSILAELDAQTNAKLLLKKLNAVEPPSFSLGLTQEFGARTTPYNEAEKQGEEGEKYVTTNDDDESGDVNDNGEDDESGDDEESEGGETDYENGDEDETDNEEENGLEDEVGDGEIGEEEGTKEKTPKQIKNRQPARYVKSPYIVRILDPNTSPVKKHMDLAAYLMSKDNHTLLKLFQYGDVATTKEDLCTLVTKGCFVESNVISTYSLILNFREKYKAPTSPSRVFFPIDVVSKLVNIDDNSKSYSAFKTDMDMYLENWSTFKNVDHVRLFFFPVFFNEHFIVACFNFSTKTERYDLLDNKTEGRTSLEKYGNIPSKLQEFFAQWLDSKQLPYKASSVRSLKARRLQMKWRDQSNHSDCAVYAMRHMETYKGNGLEGWNVGLEKGKLKPLQNLRFKYAYDIVNFEGNEVKSEVFSLVRQLLKEASK